MNTRFLIPLLGAAALAFACGPRGPQARDAPSPTAAARAKRHKPRAGEPPLAPALDVRVGNGVALALEVVNVSDKKLEVTFPNGRTHDFAVLDSLGREVWRWSRSRMFTTALQSRTVGAGDTIAYEERWTPTNAHGRFTAVAVLASENYPVERRVEFTLP